MTGAYSFGGPDASVILPRTDLSDNEVNRICDTVRECGYQLHTYFRNGFREKVYERSLIHRLAKKGVQFDVHPRVKVFDEDGYELIEEQFDLIVERVIVVELKAVSEVSNFDVAQLLGYLRASQFRHGLLVNFGNPKFSIKKYVMGPGQFPEHGVAG